jgi:uncharacterized protein YjbI with pentapeptide repeats
MKITTYEEFKKYFAENGSVSRFSTDAILTDAILTDADLRGAILTGAILRGAILTGAILTGAKDIVSVSGVGSEGRTAYFVNHHDDIIMVQAGCFWGTTDELLAESEKEYGQDSDHYRGYEAAVAYATTILNQHRESEHHENQKD